MTKLVWSSSALAIVLAMPAVAAAQATPNGPCPPGSWFCAPPPPQAAAPAPPPLAAAPPLPDPEASAEEAPPPPPPPRRRPPVVTYQPAPPPPVVVYQPPPPTMVVRPEVPPPYQYAPPPPPSHPRQPFARRSEWGLNLHLEGATFGSGYEHNAGMGGLGAGLRFRPNPYFALETDLDFIGGHGYVGDVRHETALSFDALLFLNPRSKAQVYLLAGIGWDWANSQPDPNNDPTASYNNNYTYFGGEGGIGLELRLTRVLAFNADLRGIIRASQQSTPEFTNPSNGQTTNTSGGALVTGGMTLYF